MIIQCPIDNVPMHMLARSSAGKVFECPRCKNRSSFKTEELAMLGEEVKGDGGEKPQTPTEPELPTPQMSKVDQQELAQHVYQEGTTAEEIELSKSGQSDNWNKAIGTLAKILELPLSVVNDRVRAPREDETVVADLTIDEIEGCAHEKTHQVEDREICDLCGVDLEEGWEENDTVQSDVAVQEKGEGFNPQSDQSAVEVDLEAHFSAKRKEQNQALEDEEMSDANSGEPVIFEGSIHADELPPGEIVEVQMTQRLQTRAELLSALADLDEQDEKKWRKEQEEVDRDAEKDSGPVQKTEKKPSPKPKSRRKKKARTAKKRKKVKSVAKD